MHILIVDDEPAIAGTLAYALASEGYATTAASLGQEAIRQVEQGNFALVILDVGLPDLNGFEVCRRIRRGSDVPVIFLTARNDEVDRIVGLELGADDYVTKPFSPREVVSRVKAILRRARPAPGRAETPPDMPFTVDKEGLRIAFHGQWLALTRYEYRLLALLLDKPGRVHSRAGIMDHVWEDAEDTLERTVDTHIKTLRAKLKAIADDESIVTHRGLGYSIDLRDRR